MNRFLLVSLLVGCASPHMATFTDHGYTLSGGEYWPYTGSTPLRYPEDILWGFYPVAGETAPGETEPNATAPNPVAVSCATRAWHALRDFLHDPPPELEAYVARNGTTRKFYLWVNDYSKASTPYVEPLRPARLWYWKRKEPSTEGKPPGYWKWESTLTQTGECQIPGSAQIKSFLTSP